MKLRPSLLATTLLLSAAGTAAAQTQGGQLHLGPRLSYEFDLERVGVGAQFSAPIARNLEFYPSFDWFLVDGGNAWNLNADLKYRAAPASAAWLYVGGGLNIARRDPDGPPNRTDTGGNLFVGAESRVGRIHPFSEFRLALNNGSSAQLLVGLNFTLR